MQYSASGNITQKSVTGTTLLSGVVSNVSYTNNYQYGGSQPHAVSTIKDASNNPTHYLSLDANGNMTQLNIPAQGMSRWMCWDEENRLTVVRDPEQFSHYIYNAGGERVWKLSGQVERMTINGDDYIDQASLDKTLYASPYMILTEREYTKHYFIESQRVTTKLGGGMDNNLVDPFNGTLSALEGDVGSIAQDLYDNLMQISCTERMNVDISPQFEIMNELTQMDNDERDLYFYHGDHLGSSSWITDASGYVDQHLAYMPFGEDFINERSGRDVRFKFTGKERDAETGFDYFGARYYNSVLSIWMSVDRYSDKFPSMNPYMYTAGNPVKLTDPTGNFFVIDDAIVGFFKGLFSKKNDEGTFSEGAKSRFGNGVKRGLRDGGNSLKLWGGLFVSDKEKSFSGRAWEVASRFTWQTPQTVIGLLYNHAANMFGNITGVEYFHGATAVKGAGIDGGAVTLGSFISLSHISSDVESNVGVGAGSYTFMHEYGHYLQSQKSGLAYLVKYGLPSITGKEWPEWDANQRAADYLQGVYSNFKWDPNYYDTQPIPSWVTRGNEQRYRNFMKRYTYLPGYTR
jgi:RHS repeat-associated protein